MKITRSISILRYDETKSEWKDDVVIQEVGLRILLVDSRGEENFALVHTLPSDYDSLIIGLLFTSRLISTPDDIIDLKVRNQLARVRFADRIEFREKLNAIRPSARIVMGLCGPEEGSLGTWRACDVPAIETSNTISPPSVRRAIQQMSNNMALYQQTGGTHGAALADIKGKLVQVAEDVGRHNAVDRVIGRALQKGLNLTNMILVCSGRLTGDLVLKAAVTRIPIVVSISAAVSSGIELAEVAGITLIGFVRGARMNIYTHPNRISGLAN